MFSTEKEIKYWKGNQTHRHIINWVIQVTSKRFTEQLKFIHIYFDVFFSNKLTHNLGSQDQLKKKIFSTFKCHTQTIK